MLVQSIVHTYVFEGTYLKPMVPAMSRYMLFPCLRATADLLMMPKEVLTDRAIRAEVVPGLSLRRICQLLQRYVSDDFAPDPLPPGLHLSAPGVRVTEQSYI